MGQPLATRSTVAGYRIEGLIGHSLSGETYRATQLALERPVALTVLDPELAGDESFRTRFLRAARLAASLDHPNVVPVHEVGEEGGRLFVASAYVEGEDLAALLAREGRLEPERAARIVAQVAEALECAHAQGLVHGNLTTRSVLVGKRNGDDHAVVTDFGFAPEDADMRTDIDGLVRLLLRAITGEASPASLPEYLRPALVLILRRALAKAQDARYATPGELARALDAAVEQAPSRRGRRSLALGSVVLLLAVGATLGVLAAVGAFSGKDASVAAGRAGAVRAGTLGKPVALASPPGKMAVGEGYLWVASWEEETVTKVDPRLNDVVGVPVQVKRFSGGLAAGEGEVWVGTEAGVVRVDPGALEVDAPVDVGGSPYEIAVGEGAVWAVVVVGKAGPPDWSLARIDLVSGRVSHRPLAFGDLDRPDEEEWHLLVAEGSVWLSATARGQVLRIDPADGRVLQRIEVGGAPGHLAAAGGVIWVPDGLGQRLVRIDPRNGRVSGEPIIPRGGVQSLAFDGTALWVLTLEGVLRRIDPVSAQLLDAPLRLGLSELNVDGFAGGDGGAWLFGEGRTVTRVIPAADLPRPDPSAVYVFSGPGPWTVPDYAALPAGRYRTDEFQVPFSFRLTDGWRAQLAENRRFIGLAEDAARGLDAGNLSFLVINRVFSPDASREVPPPQDLVAWLRSHPHLATTVRGITVGGVPARQVEVRVRTTPKPNPPECLEQPCVELFRVAENHEWVLYPKWVARFVVVDFGGRQLVVVYESPGARFDAFAPKADAVLRSVTFGRP